MRGGKRPGAGRKRGVANKLTVEQKGTISEMAKGYIEDALSTLAGIMRSTKATPTARVAAANAILDRACGKPPQALEHTGKNGGPMEFVQQLLSEIDGKSRGLPSAEGPAG